MAGDWIKMKTNLANDPAVIIAAERLGLDEFTIVGKLHGFWSWANHHMKNGEAVGITSQWVDRYVNCEGFAAVLCEVGWLEVTENGIRIPTFERHNGEGAKKRALGWQRTQKYRDSKISAGNAASVTDALPEKRREEKEKSVKSPPNPPKEGRELLEVSDRDFPDNLNTAVVRSSLDDWLEHKRAIGKPYKLAKSISLLLKRWQENGPAAFVDAVEYSIGQGYQGLFAPSGVGRAAVANPARLRTGQTYDDMEVIDVDDLS